MFWFNEDSFKLSDVVLISLLTKARRHHYDLACLPPRALKKSTATTCATTRPCGELWLVEGCPHMDPPTLLHQPQLATWASCDTSCATKLLQSFSFQVPFVIKCIM